jgi:hypothetical protein
MECAGVGKLAALTRQGGLVQAEAARRQGQCGQGFVQLSHQVILVWVQCLLTRRWRRG